MKEADRTHVDLANGGCDRFRIRDDAFSRESVSAGFGPQCKSHGCNESRRCRATCRCWVCLVAGRANTFRVSCASACSELMARKLVASLSFVQIVADEFSHMLQNGERGSYSSTMAGELQHLVDTTGRRLDRSVAIDDAQIRLLAYNSHDSAVDSVRMNSVLQRNVSREIVDFIYASGGREALDLFTVPVNEELGLTLGRVGMPIRYRNALLGFVWLLTSEGEVDEDQAEVLRRTADAAAMILHREQLLDELSRSRERELTRDVLSGERSLREDAASRLADEGLMAVGPAVAVTMLLRPVDRSTLTERDRLSVAVGVDQLRRRLPRNSAIQLDRPDHSLLIVSVAERSTQTHLDSLIVAARERVLSESGRQNIECWVGIGEPRTSVADVRESYEESRRSADVAQVVKVLGNVVHYRDLGVYGLLAELSEDRLENSIHSGLQSLLSHEDSKSEALLATLESFLDNAGDVKRTSEALCVHRGSLYYRLRRIQEITRADLANGDDRLALHLSLKVARLLDLR